MASSKISAGYIYFIKEKMSGTIKIGKTKHIGIRFTEFSVKLPFKWDVVTTIESADYNLTETLLHRHYASKRVNGEWFGLSDNDISDITSGNFTQEIKQSIAAEGEIYERK